MDHKDLIKAFLSSRECFRFLETPVQQISTANESLRKSNFSSEDQVRYRSPAGQIAAREDVEFEFQLNRKLWKLLSSRQRRLVYQLSILAGLDDYLRDLEERLLTSSLGDQVIRLAVKKQLRQNEIMHHLSELSDKERLNLVRIVGDLLRTLERKGVTLTDFFIVKPKGRLKPRPRKLVRHKGYRDHGSLGKDSIGLSEEMKSRYIEDPQERRRYIEFGITWKDFISEYSHFLTYRNIWIF